MDTLSENFGFRLRGLIDSKGKSVEAFADEFGIARSTAHNWLNLETPPLRKHWPALSKYFGVSESYLVHGRPESSAEPVVAEDQAPYGTPATLEAEVRRHLDAVITAARNNPARLGWIAEQLKAFVAIPAHWQSGVRLGRITPQSETAQPLPNPSHQSRSA
jgi:transcriptional regulator with XRE-family HTH domain